jgi:hypothetical protein
MKIKSIVGLSLLLAGGARAHERLPADLSKLRTVESLTPSPLVTPLEIPGRPAALPSAKLEPWSFAEASQLDDQDLSAELKPGSWLRVGRVDQAGPGTLDLDGFEVSSWGGRLRLLRSDNPAKEGLLYADWQGDISDALTDLSKGPGKERRVFALKSLAVPGRGAVLGRKAYCARRGESLLLCRVVTSFASGATAHEFHAYKPANASAGLLKERSAWGHEDATRLYAALPDAVLKDDRWVRVGWSAGNEPGGYFDPKGASLEGRGGRLSFANGRAFLQGEPESPVRLLGDRPARLFFHLGSQGFAACGETRDELLVCQIMKEIRGVDLGYEYEYYAYVREGKLK